MIIDRVDQRSVCACPAIQFQRRIAFIKLSIIVEPILIGVTSHPIDSFFLMPDSPLDAGSEQGHFHILVDAVVYEMRHGGILCEPGEGVSFFFFHGALGVLGGVVCWWLWSGRGRGRAGASIRSWRLPAFHRRLNCFASSVSVGVKPFRM
jgi:hypothetical protein